MKIIFEKSEAEEYFYDALCNGLGQIGYYGCDLQYKDKDYKEAKESLRELKKKEIIDNFENIFMKYHNLSKEDYESFLLSNESLIKNDEAVKNILENYNKEADNDMITEYLVRFCSLEFPDIMRSICYEDILMQILRDGKTLTIVDEEGGDDEYPITLIDVHERMTNVPIHNITNIIEGNDDAYDADAIIQTVFFQDIMFG